jgi:hypothetical protein
MRLGMDGLRHCSKKFFPLFSSPGKTMTIRWIRSKDDRSPVAKSGMDGVSDAGHQNRTRPKRIKMIPVEIMRRIRSIGANYGDGWSVLTRKPRHV